MPTSASQKQPGSCSCLTLTQGPQSAQSVPRSHCTVKMVRVSGCASGGALAVGRPSSQTPFEVKPVQVSEQTVLVVAGLAWLLPPLPALLVVVLLLSLLL